jgi:hypothetical protein
MRQLANGENSIKRSLIPSNTSFSCFYGWWNETGCEKLGSGKDNHVNRGSPANILTEEECLLSYFCGSALLHTLEHIRPDHINCVSQPGARRERIPQQALWQNLTGCSWLTLGFIRSVLLHASAPSTTHTRN